MDATKLLNRAREAFEESTTYVDTNYRLKWEASLNHFQNKHAASSKYYKESYKYRSKAFMPKTRSFVRLSESKAMAALFSNQDVVAISPADSDDPAQVVSAKLNQALLNYRLTNSIPWFQICMGAIQQANVVGVICSYQHWDFQSKKGYIAFTDENGAQQYNDAGKPLFRETVKILKDKPKIELRPINNIRFSPSADWTDPVNTSPYFIDIIPMYIIDVETKMNEKDQKTDGPKWKRLTRAEMVASKRNQYDSTDSVRRGDTEDPNEVSYSKDLQDYTTVWVHRNFIRDGETDYVFYSMGTKYLLTDPVPIDEIYFTGMRPYVIGCGAIEAHKVMPDSPVYLAAPLQVQANELTNARNDNIQLVLNKRYLGSRGANVDWRSVLRNAPGSVTLVNDVDRDLKTLEFDDVTGSSYKEQDLINMNLDELLGVFSTSSVGANRNLAETVGGMQIMKSDNTQITEYAIRTIAETWIEPVMKQLVMLEQKYESDEIILALCAKKAKIYQRYGTTEQLDEILNQSVTTTVNLGMDATDPMTKVQKLLFALGRVNEIMSTAAVGVNKEEVIKEVFGTLGYKDGSRFYDPNGRIPPDVQQQIEGMQQEIQKLQGQLADREKDRQMKIAIAEMDVEAKDSKAEKDRMAKLAIAEMQAEAQTDAAETQAGGALERQYIKEAGDQNRAELNAATNIAVATINKTEEGEEIPNVAIVS